MLPENNPQQLCYVRSHMVSEEHNHEVLVFEPAFLLRTPYEGTNQAPKATVSTYRKNNSRSAFSRPCIEQRHTYSSTSVPTRVRQYKQITEHAWKSQSGVAESQVQVLIICFFPPSFLVVPSLFICLPDLPATRACGQATRWLWPCRQSGRITAPICPYMYHEAPLILCEWRYRFD